MNINFLYRDNFLFFLYSIIIIYINIIFVNNEIYVNIYLLFLVLVLSITLKVIYKNYLYNKYDDIFYILLTIFILLSIFIIWIDIYKKNFIYKRDFNKKIYVSLEARVNNIKYDQDNNLEIYFDKISLYQKKSLNKKIKHKKSIDIESDKYKERYYLNYKDYLNLNLDKDQIFQFESYFDIFDENGIFKNPPPLIKVKIKENLYDKYIDILPKLGDLIKTDIFIDQINNNFSNYYYNGNRYIFAYIANKIVILDNEGNNRFNFLEKINNLRYDISNKLYQKYNQYGAIISAITIGIKDNIDINIKEDIRKSGISHIFAISGLHMSIIAFAIYFIFSKLILAYISRYNLQHINIFKISIFPTIIFTFIYLTFTGFYESAVRAFFMISIFLFSKFLDKENDNLKSIFVTAIIMLIINPFSIKSISFQLSFMATLILILFTKYFNKINPNNIKSNNIILKILYYLLMIIISSILIQLFTILIAIYYFGSINIYSVISNLIIIPLSSFIIIPLSFISFLLSFVNLEFLSIFLLKYPIDFSLYYIDMIASLPKSEIYINMEGKSYLLLIFISVIFLYILYQKLITLILIKVTYIIIFIIILNIKKPDIILDNSKFFALYDNENNKIIFSKEKKSDYKKNKIFKLLDNNEYILLKNTDKYGKCYKKYCNININGKNILIILSRIKKNIINDKFDKIINLDNRYILPDKSNYNLKKNNSNNVKIIYI